MNTIPNPTTQAVQRCTITPAAAQGSGYIANRIYTYTGIVTGYVEITDTVRHDITYETNECFARKFTKI